MPQHVRLWEIDDRAGPKDLPQSKLNFESRLEEWLERDSSMLGSDLLVIGKQVPTDFGGFIDLLCIDSRGDLVIVELKRDKTPREITAQALDYASWVVSLASDRIGEIANAYLRERGPLETAFAAKFNADLPDSLNQGHKMLIVASSVDQSSERIIRYLSEHHGVNINAATFQFFRSRESTEFLARVFLAEPSQVEQRTRESQRTKRKPNLTQDELMHLASNLGVGESYQEIVDLLRSSFDGIRTTRSTLNFVRQHDGSKVTVVNLVPAESDPDHGVRFQVFAKRVAKLAGMSDGDVRAALPHNAEPWSFGNNGDPEWSGFAGYWTPADARAFRVAVLDRRGA